MSEEATIGMFDGFVVPTVLHGCKARGLNAESWRRIHVLEIKCFRTVTEMRWFDRVRHNSQECRVVSSCAENGEGIILIIKYLENLLVRSSKQKIEGKIKKK